MKMDPDTVIQEGQLGSNDMEDGDEISIDCLLKEGTATAEDVMCIIRDIADNPEEMRELVEVLGIDGDQLPEDGTDSVDGAKISSCHPMLTNVTYEGLYAALDSKSLNRRDLIHKHCLINKDLIPTSILARGKRTLAAYRRALKHGKTYDKRVKVVLIGQDRPGKTSVGRALRGEALQNDEPSTDGVQMNEPLKYASEKPWRYSNRKSSGYENNIAEMMRQDLSAGPRVPLSGEAAGSKEVVTKDVAIELTAVTQQPTETQQSAPLDDDGNCLTSLMAQGKNEVDAIPEEIASLLEESLEHDEIDTSDGIWPVIWELGGQSVVDRAMHPIFMTPEAVYLLVFDLSKDLFVNAAECNDSSLDHMMRYMDTVHSSSLKRSTDDHSFPHVILVGTHADCCVQEGAERRMEYLSARLLDSENPLIDEYVAGHFAVDNTQSGQASGKEDIEIVRLRQKVLEVANKMPHTKKEIPLHWLYIESAIEGKALREKYVPKGRFKEEIVEKVCKSEETDDIEQVLHFLHDRGTIVYQDGPDDPDGLVVLDPQWLVNVIRQILDVAQSKDESMKVCKRRKQLQDKGILAEELLDHACEKLGVCEIKQSLTVIMEKFNLLFRCQSIENQPEYLVPCMLTAQKELSFIQDTDSSPVYLTFGTDYVPLGLFPRLAAFFGVWAASKTSCKQQPIFANAACFILDDKNFLGLVCYKSVIKLNVWSHDNSLYGDSECHSEVCSYLERSLAIIRDECHWLRSMSCELSVRCTLCAGKTESKTGLCVWHNTKGCLHDDCAHYMPLKNGQYYCPYAKGHDKVIPEETFEAWLRALENNNVQEETVPSVQPTLIPCKQDKSKVQVTLLSGEWGSSKGGLPTVNRLLAIELAKHPHLEVTLYVAKCNEEDERMANSYGINIVKATERPGYDPLDWLGFCPSEGFGMDVVIGHGVKLGKQAQLLRQFYPKCVWIQFEHTAPEELAMYKKYSRNISIGEEKHDTEVQLSKMADLVVAVGPKLAEVFRRYLRPYPKKRVFEIVPSPSIFQEFSKCKQAKQDGETFNVLVFGRGDEEDFELKGYDLAPKAIAELKDQRCHLYFVGAAKGELEKVTKRLLKHGISERQLTVRGFIESREKLASQLCEVDLSIMPSRTEGFGLTALEALSAGLPILVGANSGFAEALKKLNTPIASSCVVDSDDGKVWAAAIQAVMEKPRTQRLQDAQRLKACFEKTYSWPKQCGSLSKEVLALVRERKGAVNTDANGDNNLPGAGEKDEGLAAPPSTLPQRTVTVEELDHTNNSPTNFHEPDALQEDKDGLDETSPFVASQNEYDSNQRTSEHGSMSLQDRKLDAESSDVLIKKENEPQFVHEVMEQTDNGFRLRRVRSETTEDESANTATAMHRRTRGEKKYPDTKTVIRERNVQRKACITGLMMALIALTVIAIFLLQDILTVR